MGIIYCSIGGMVNIMKNTSHHISGLDQRGSMNEITGERFKLSAGRSRVGVTRPGRPERKE